jgi:hypothetical protein
VNVYQSAVSPESAVAPKREEEAAIDLVHHMSSLTPGGTGQSLPAYLPAQRPADNGPPFPPYVPALILLCAPAAHDRLRDAVRSGHEAEEHVEATLTESMRCRPVVPVLGRRVTVP